MKKIDLSIEIVSTTLPGLSSLSLPSRLGMLRELELVYSSVKITIINTMQDLENLALRKPDIVFLGFKYLQNDTDSIHKIWIADFLKENDILYTGSEKKAHFLELHKHLSKRHVIKAGLKTADYYVATDSTSRPAGLLFPLFVKPTSMGGGSGVDSASLVHTDLQLTSKVNAIRKNQSSDSLVETYLAGREFSVAILRNEFKNTFSLLPLELTAPLNELGDRFLSQAIKSADTETYKALTDKKLSQDLCTLALKSFQALGGRDYGRIDIRLDENNTPNFLEANLLPSLLENYGNFPKACKLYLGLSYTQMLQRIIHLAQDRFDDDSDSTTLELPHTPTLLVTT